MSAAVQARRELAEEKMTAIAEAKRLAEVNANGSNRLAALNDRGPRTTSMSSEYKHAEKAKASAPADGSLKGGAVGASTPGVTNCDKRQSRQSCASSASIEDGEKQVGKPKAGVPGASPQGGTAGSDTPADNNACDNQQSSATSTSVEEEEEEWQRACDQTTGKKYFWNLRTNEVRWFTAEEEEGEAEQGEEEGWERVLDQTTGKEYFWHNVTDEVRWTEPPELAVNRAAAE